MSLFLLRKMVPPHSTMLSRNTYIKQLLMIVKSKFVAQSIAQFVAHGDGVAADAVTQ